MKIRFASAAALLLAASAFAQDTLNRQIGQDYVYDYNSGVLGNPGQEFVKVAQTVVSLPSTAWQRIYFSDLQLEGDSYIIMTSLKDGEFQKFDAATAAMWSNGSAYFNGDKILVEVYAAPGTTNNKVVVNKLAAEMPVNEPEGGSGQCGICGATDDRVLSSNDAMGRVMSIGCTATIYCRSSGMVTAGHCLAAGLVVHFRVPASTAGCATVAPAVADQFPVLATAGVNGGVGNDYGTLKMGVNNLGETPYHRYNTLVPIGVPPVLNAAINFWGYGVDLTCTRSQVEQFSSGSVIGVSGTRIDYNADLRGGNSGSSILNSTSSSIVGIVTHCTNGSCDNIGTTINHAGFVSSRNTLNPECTSNLLLLNVQTAGAVGVGITVSAADVNALQNGTSNFKRVYASGANVSFTAPATAAGLCFTGWTLNGNALGGNPVTVNVTADGTLVANYGSCGPTPPPNNACGNAIDVSAGGTFNGTLVAATNDGTASCGASAGNPDVWYSYTNSSCRARVLNVNMCGSNAASSIDTVISFHTACGGSEIACDDDSFNICTPNVGTLDSDLSTNVPAGATVKIRVSKFSGAILAPFIMNVSSTSNDTCANATLVPAGSYTFCNVGANTDGPAACGAIGSDLWYRYTATANGLVTVKTCGSSFDTVVAVYADGCPAATQLACNDDDGNVHCPNFLDSWTQFNATGGTTYLVRVGGFGASQGNGNLIIQRFCTADFNGDGSLDFFDYLDFVDAFSANLPSADFNGDGSIDFFDYLDFVDAFSTGC